MVSEYEETMSQGKQNGFHVIIPKNSEKDSEKLWKEFIGEETKASVRKEYNELVVHHANLKSFGNDTMSIYAAFKDADGRTQLSAFFAGLDSVFLTSSKQETQSVSAKLMVRNFAVFAYKDGVSKQLKEEEKKAEKLEGELKQLENNISTYENEIKKNKREIDREKAEIKTMQTQEEFTTAEVLKQKQLLTTFSGSSEAREIDEKKLRELEKEKTKLTKDLEKSNRKIDKLEDVNKNHERSIDNTKDKMIPDKKAEIESQKETTRQIEKLLDNIR